MPCRVFIADDVEALRVLWREFLASEEEIEIVGEAADGEATIAGVRESNPDVLVLDLSMPRADGLEVIRAVREDLPDMRIVVASGFAAARLAPVALELGADSYFEKGRPPTELRDLVLGQCDASHPFGGVRQSADD